MGRMRSMLLIISVATFGTLCHGSPLGIGTLDLKLRTPEGRNFNPVQFANEWVDSVSISVVPVRPVIKNVEIVPVFRAVPVPFRSTPVFVQRESIPVPVVTQNPQPTNFIPRTSIRLTPVEVVETPPIVAEPVLKPVPVNVELSPIVYEPVEVAPVVVEQASIIVEHVEKYAPLVETIVEDVPAHFTPITHAPAVAPVVKSAPVIVKLSPEPINTFSSVKPSVNIISHAAPIVKTPLSKVITVLRPIPVISGDVVQKAEAIFVEASAPIVSVSVPIVKSTLKVVAETPIVKDIPAHFTTLVHSSPSIVAAALPVVKAAPEIIIAVAPEPLDAPNPPMPTPDVPFRGGQFHAQDEQGQYAFGHYGGSSTRVETKDSLGRVSGSFAYVNPDGDVEVRKYSSAPGVGFKVAASDIPQDTPEVAQVKEELSKLIADTRASRS